MADYNSTTFDLSITGAEEVAQGFNKIAAAAKEAGIPVADTGKKLDDAGGKSKDTADRMGNVAGAIGLVGRGLGELNPQMGQLTSLASGAVGQFTSLSNQMGVAGGAVALVAVSIAALAHDIAQLHEAETEETAAVQAETDARHAHTTSIADEMAAIQHRQQAEAQEDAIRARVQAGVASLAETQALYHQQIERQNAIIQANRDQHAKLEEALDKAAHSGFAWAGTLDRMQQEITDNETATDAAQRAVHRLYEEMNHAEEAARRWEETQRALNLELAETAKQKRGEQEAEDARAADTNLATSQRLAAQLEQRQNARRGGSAPRGFNAGGYTLQGDHSGETTIDVSAENDANARKEMDHLAAVGRAEADLQRRRSEQAKERVRWQQEEHTRALHNIEEEQAKRQALADAIGTSLNAVGDLAQSLAKNEADGIKVKAGFTGAMEVVEAAVAEAQAISDFASLNFISGAGHQAAAIAHAVAAGKAFAIAGGGGGASAGSGGAASAGAAGGSAQPRSPDTGAGRGGGGVTILITGPWMASGTRAEMARMLAPAFREAGNRFGRDPYGMPR